jgi:hypothetical protein
VVTRRGKPHVRLTSAHPRLPTSDRDPAAAQRTT